MVSSVLDDLEIILGKVANSITSFIHSLAQGGSSGSDTRTPASGPEGSRQPQSMHRQRTPSSFTDSETSYFPQTAPVSQRFNGNSYMPRTSYVPAFSHAAAFQGGGMGFHGGRMGCRGGGHFRR